MLILNKKMILAGLLLGCLQGCQRSAIQQSTDGEQNELELSEMLELARTNGEWQGWGTSLAWWGKAVGGSAFEDQIADLMFTDKDTRVAVMNRDIPGLNFNIVRYNIGGGGQPGDIADLGENVPDIQPWFKDIDGFWTNWYDMAPNSASYDWNRDPEQRSMMKSAMARNGNRLEFFANAPMWWMMDSKSSAGGTIQSWNHHDFARYLARVVSYAEQNWGVTVDYIEPFNEPSAGWWTYPKNQEGANISRETQGEIIGHLNQELISQNTLAKIAASDENSMDQASLTIDHFSSQQVDVGGSQAEVFDLVQKVNVHSYSGLDPWRDNVARKTLHEKAGERPIWISEFGDDDGDGRTLAQSILEDIHYLGAKAWVYWQAVEEQHSSWGLMNVHFGHSLEDPMRGEPTWVYTKYYVMAHFSRYILDGMLLIDQENPWTVVAHDPQKNTLNFVVVNLENQPKPFSWRLVDGTFRGEKVFELKQTKFNSSTFWITAQGTVQDDSVKLTIAPDSIVSFSLQVEMDP